MLSLTQEKGALDLIFVVLKELGENKIAVAIVLLFLSTGAKVGTQLPLPRQISSQSHGPVAFKIVLTAVILKNGREDRVRHQ